MKSPCGHGVNHYYTINVCNFILSRTTGDNAQLSESMKRIKGQALFLRAFLIYNLVGYYKDVPLITDYSTYSSLDGLYGTNNTLMRCSIR